MHQNTPDTASFRERIASRRAQLAASAVAATLAVGALTTSTAEAAIYTAPTNLNGFGFDPLDGSTALTTSTTADNPLLLAACGSVRLHVDASLAGSGDFSFFGPAPEEYESIIPLAAGVTIDDSGIFHQPSPFRFLIPAADALNYIGFRYTNQGPDADETYYGWVEFTYPGNNELVVTRFAIGGPGEIIVTGQDASPIPEPSSAGALVGALALGAIAPRRRRR